MRDSLDKSILRVTLSYAGIQVLMFSSFGLASGFFSRYVPAFLVSCIGFHIVLYSLLRVFKRDFALADTGAMLERVNLANLITLFRVSSLPTLLFLVLAAKDYRIKVPLLIMIVLVFASDFIDGYVSRTQSQITRIGKMMDSASDYAVLVVLTIVFYYFHFIKIWFFALVIGRLAIQTAFMAALYLIRGKIKPRTTFMGKAAIASIMVLYAAEILELVVPVGLMSVLRWLQWAAAAVVGLSVIDKILAFRKDLAEAETEPVSDAKNAQGGS
jgi:phosphatidylglycerophosphate synthase